MDLQRLTSVNFEMLFWIFLWQNWPLSINFKTKKKIKNKKKRKKAGRKSHISVDLVTISTGTSQGWEENECNDLSAILVEGFGIEEPNCRKVTAFQYEVMLSF